MSTRKLRLSRRAILRGAGVAIALPLLDSMMNDAGWIFGAGAASAQPAAPPVRVILFFLPNGLPWDGSLRPTTTGRGYAVPPGLVPVSEFLDDVTVMSNVFGVGGGHGSGTVGFGTGLRPTRDGDPAASVATGPSVDQAAASLSTTVTRFPSLNVQPNPRAVSDNPPIGANISWSSGGRPNPADDNPAMLFDRLFSDSTGGGSGVDAEYFARLRRNRQSVLDLVMEDIERYQMTLGVSDTRQLDAHLTAIRGLEERLPVETMPVVCEPPTRPAESGLGPTERANLMADLLSMALTCNLTHHATYMYDGSGGSGYVDESAIRARLSRTGHQHVAAHDGDMEMCQAYTAEQLTVFARFLGNLRAAPEGAHNILYNSVILLGSELGNGQAHAAANHNILLCGRAGGRITTHGMHIHYTDPPREAPKLAQVHLAMLRLAGFDVASFAEQTEAAPELGV